VSEGADCRAAPYDLGTERLHLRALTLDDEPFLAELYADPEVARFIGGDRLTPEAVHAQAARFVSVWESSGYGQSAVLSRRTGETVGRVGLHPWPEWGELELGWVLERRHQGQGLAQEAARAWLAWAAHARPAPYLIAVIHPDNSASIRLAERLGFVHDRADVTPWSEAAVFRADLL
jgi:RimJ/RimL family protein N-acetyltransferase